MIGLKKTCKKILETYISTHRNRATGSIVWVSEFPIYSENEIEKS